MMSICGTLFSNGRRVWACDNETHWLHADTFCCDDHWRTALPPIVGSFTGAPNLCYFKESDESD